MSSPSPCHIGRQFGVILELAEDCGRQFGVRGSISVRRKWEDVKEDKWKSVIVRETV